LGALNPASPVFIAQSEVVLVDDKEFPVWEEPRIVTIDDKRAKPISKQLYARSKVAGSDKSSNYDAIIQEQCIGSGFGEK
jgi:hypothetical protein